VFFRYCEGHLFLTSPNVGAPNIPLCDAFFEHLQKTKYPKLPPRCSEQDMAA